MKPLWEHQKNDIETYLSIPNVFNTSDPGTGKTRVIIEAIRRLNLPTLILAPKSILSCAWGNDFHEFAPEVRYAIATAQNRKDAFKSIANGTAKVIITNHDAVTWLVRPENISTLDYFDGGILVIDESTAYKNPQAKRSKAAAKIRGYFSRSTCLSGTPTPQGIIDIWHQMYLVDRGALLGSSFYRFRANTHSPVNKGAFTEWMEKPGVADAIGDIISEITIRNRREDCMDLPENLIIKRNFDLSSTHYAQYLQLRRQAILKLESGTVSAMNAAVLINKLLQLLSGAVYDEQGTPHLISTERYDLVMDLVEERPHSVVVFNWKHQRDEMIKIATQHGFTYRLIDGTINNMYTRTNTVAEFQAGKIKVLFIHPQSAGHGITLTKGVATIWASPTYNSELFAQTNARIYRGGQTQKTETILISANNTVDEAAYEALDKKLLNMNNLLEIL